MIKSIFETGNTRFFKDVELARGDKVRDFVFEEKYVTIFTVAIDDDQAPILDIVQEANPDQDNVEEPPI